MSRTDKLLQSLRECDGPFPLKDFIVILGALGYEELGHGRTSGSRVKFHNAKSGHVVMFHRPHGAEIGIGTIRALRQNLVEAGVL